MTEETRESELLRQAVSAIPKPLIRQALIGVPVLFELAVRLLLGDVSGAGHYGEGLLLLVVATAVAAVAGRVPAWLVAALPWVDLAAVGLMRLVPDGNGLGLLAVLPTMWLAADRQLRGVAMGFLGTLVLVSLPSIGYYGMDPAWWSRALLIPTVAGMCALTVAGAGDLWARQNRRLEESRALNAAIVSTVDVGLVAVDDDGGYRAVNPRQEQFLAVAYPEGHRGLAGQTGEIYGPDRVTRLLPEELPSTRAARREHFRDQLIWVGADPAHQRALSVSAGPVIDVDGAFRGSVLSYHDVTDLMAALRVKDEFVASVSHELRTPLTSIMGFLELVLDDEVVSPSVREQLEVIHRNGERLLGLVGDLLLTAQAAEGRMPLTKQATDLSALAEQAVEQLLPRAAAKGVTVRCDLAPDAMLLVDPLRARQVVDNLVCNAVKYTPVGGTVVLTVIDLAGEVVLTVRDTGIGIAAEDRERLFTRFFRASEAHDLAIQGVGLGLAICKSIVDAHGGTIELDSEVGRGSTFRVRLPRVNVEPSLVPVSAGASGSSAASLRV
ncbi:MAG TPA: PAS domain-containing sensor histidine kinase [Marmoricola sp.]|nr:PAS domain-containing sensor histidine kinase [Marmoricola sp.]